MSFPNGLVPTTDRVHPTPIYELIAACVIAWILWRIGAKQIAAAGKVPAGLVFAAYLVLTGIARFLVEFIRINPRSFFGMTNAQAASLASIVFGIILWWQVRSGSKKRRLTAGLYLRALAILPGHAPQVIWACGGTSAARDSGKDSCFRSPPDSASGFAPET